VCTTVANTVAQ